MADDNELTGLLTRGFAGVNEQLRERDADVRKLSENLIRMEGDIKTVTTTLARVEGELSKSESVGVGIRLGNLETQMKEFKTKQDSNATWIRGLLVSVVLLLLGVLFNFLKASLVIK